MRYKKKSPTFKIIRELTFDVHIRDGDDDDEFEEGKGEVYSFCTVLKSLTQFNLQLSSCLR